MKKMMTLLSMIALAFVGTMMIGCSNKEYDIEQPEQPVGSRNAITLTTTISLPDTDTKALDIDYGNKILSKTFAVGERMAVLYRSQAGGITTDESDPLTAEDITNGGKTAKFTFQVYEPVKTEDVTYVYPANMVGGSYPNYHIDYSGLNAQDGTLASIASGLDLATYTGPWVDGNLPAANLTNELAIIAYTLKNADGSVDITSTITGMTINDGTYNYTVNRYATAGPIYVAIRPTNDATINYTATDGTTNYTKTVDNQTCEAGSFYQIGLRMTPSSGATGHALSSSAVGEVVGTNGLAYAPADKNNLPPGVTAAGMVAYKDGENGLVIALSDESSIKKWPEAVSAAIAHTPAVTSHAWRMPSLSEWKQMFAAFGGSETSSTGLNTAITNAGGNTLDEIHYWTSTGQEGNPANAYYIGLSGSNVTYSSAKGKTTDYSYARACCYFGYDRNAFSVSPTTKVTFAPGNLKYNDSKWDFLSKSWEYHGNDRNSQYFIWTAVFKNATISTVCDVVDGIANDLGSSWRGLSTEEWRYLMGYDQNTKPKVQSSRRPVAWHRYAVVTGTNVGSGLYLLLFPDGFKESDWTAAMGTKPTCFEHKGTEAITYTSANFTAMQAAGIIILPPAGMWDSGSYAWYQYKQGEIGLYWSSTCADATGAMSFQVWSAQVEMEWNNKSNKCYPVRLVKNVE